MTDQTQTLIREECAALAEMLVEKNRAYGNSALEPLRVFSKASTEEQIRVRLDDKLSRLARGSAAGEDVELDLLGYLILLRVHRRMASELVEEQTPARPRLVCAWCQCECTDPSTVGDWRILGVSGPDGKTPVYIITCGYDCGSSYTDRAISRPFWRTCEEAEDEIAAFISACGVEVSEEPKADNRPRLDCSVCSKGFRGIDRTEAGIVVTVHPGRGGVVYGIVCCADCSAIFARDPRGHRFWGTHKEAEEEIYAFDIACEEEEASEEPERLVCRSCGMTDGRHGVCSYRADAPGDHYECSCCPSCRAECGKGS